MNRATAHFGAAQASYWSGFCMVVVFASPFLLGVGLSNAQIGVVVSVASALSAAAQPLVAGRTDVSRRPLNVVVACGLLALAAIGGLLLLPLGAFLAGVIYGLGIVLTQLVQPLINALAMAAVARGVPVNFGIARACGSIASAVIAVVAGSWIAATGTVVIALLIVATHLICAAVLIIFKVDQGSVVTAEDAEPDEEPKALMTPTRWRRFAVVLVALTAMMTSHNMVANYLLQIMTPLGGGAAEMGTGITIAALAEVPPMMAWSLIMRRWQPGALLKVAGLAFVVKALATLAASSVAAIYAAQTLQLLAFAVMTLAAVYYAERLLPAQDRARGQAFMTLTASAGTVLGALIGGVMLDVAGVTALLLATVAAAGLGAVLVFLGVERTSRPR